MREQYLYLEVPEFYPEQPLKDEKKEEKETVIIINMNNDEEDKQ